MRQKQTSNLKKEAAEAPADAPMDKFHKAIGQGSDPLIGQDYGLIYLKSRIISLRVIFITNQSGSGKTTIGKAINQKMIQNSSRWFKRSSLRGTQG